MYRFLLRPKWLVFTAGVLALMVLMVNLSLWQWHRYGDKKDRRDLVEQRAAQAPLRVADAVAERPDPAKLEWTLVAASGAYDGATQVLIANRALDGAPGAHVVTPLRLTDGSTLLVNRGFIGLGVSPPAPPTGPVDIVARVRRTQKRGSFGPRDPATGVLNEFVRLDVERIAQQLHGSVEPFYVELVTQRPPVAASDPTVLPPPDPDLGPHLSYAGQWLIFTACAAAGWVLVVRRTGRRTMAAPEIIDATLADATLDPR